MIPNLDLLYFFLVLDGIGFAKHWYRLLILTHALMTSTNQVSRDYSQNQVDMLNSASHILQQITQRVQLIWEALIGFP